MYIDVMDIHYGPFNRQCSEEAASGSGSADTEIQYIISENAYLKVNHRCAARVDF